MDPSSACALRRARALAEKLGHELLVVHTVKGLTGKRAGALGRADEARRNIRTWAHFQAGLELGESSIQIAFGNPLQRLMEAVERCGPELVVIGGRVSETSESPGQFSMGLIERSRIPILLAAKVRRGGAFAVATDLTSPNAPVVRAATRIARRLDRRVSIIHNVPEGMDSAHMWQRVAMLGSFVAAGEDPLEEATVTHLATASAGIFQVARAKDVDVLAVGVRRSLGTTPRTILAGAERSLLFVPLTN